VDPLRPRPVGPTLYGGPCGPYSTVLRLREEEFAELRGDTCTRTRIRVRVRVVRVTRVTRVARVTRARTHHTRTRALQACASHTRITPFTAWFMTRRDAQWSIANGGGKGASEGEGEGEGARVRVRVRARVLGGGVKGGATVRSTITKGGNAPCSPTRERSATRLVHEAAVPTCHVIAGARDGGERRRCPPATSSQGPGMVVRGGGAHSATSSQEAARMVVMIAGGARDGGERERRAFAARPRGLRCVQRQGAGGAEVWSESWS
jgi:hypothetical protein